MKKSNLILALTILITSYINAQSFEKGNINVDLGLGIGVYGTEQKTTIKSEISIFGQSISNEETQDTTDGAAATIIPITFEYGFSNKFGIGADITFGNYLFDKDEKNLTSVKSSDFGLNINFHPFSTKRNDLSIGFGFGGSSIKWNYKTSDDIALKSASGNGMYFNIGVTERFFFGQHLGIVAKIQYKSYSYKTIKGEVTDETQKAFEAFNGTYSQEWEWNLTGFNAMLGVAIKI